MLIIHAATKEEWDNEKDSGFYGKKQLEKFGFIHCSDLDTYHFVSSRFDTTKNNMIMLYINKQKIKNKIIWETGSIGVAFPHIYGLLNVDAVEMIRELKDLTEHKQKNLYVL